MSTISKCSFGYLTSPIQKYKNLGRSLASMLIVTNEDAKAALNNDELKSDVNQFSGLNPYDKAEVELKILTPNGLLLILSVNRRATLKQIKEVGSLKSFNRNIFRGFVSMHFFHSFLSSC